MSIENNLASIAKSLEAIALALVDRKQTQLPLVAVPAAAPVSAPVPAPAPAVAPAPLPMETVQPPVPQPMATQPFVPPFVAEMQTGIPLPFTDAKTLLGYVMNKYKNLGPVKGALIQGVLAELGVKNVNEVKPEQYQTFYAKVEAIQ